MQAFRRGAEAQPRAPQEALVALNEAVSLEPDVVPFLVKRGVTFLLLKRPQDAVADLSRANALSPTPSHQLFLATAHWVAGEKGKAVKAWRALEQDPGPQWEHHPEVLCRLGKALERAKDPAGKPRVEKACAAGFRACCRPP